MKRTIEQEIDLTLSCLNATDSVDVSDVFVDTVSGRLSHLQTRRGIGYKSSAFYPVVILLMVLLNLAVLLTNTGGKAAENDGSYDQLNVIASEYGMGQSSYMSL